MEMTRAYMHETAEALAAAGFELEHATDRVERDGALVFERDTHVLTRIGERLVLESVHYPDGEDRWFLAIEAFHGMTCTSFPMDSWKHRADRVEFKFAADAETGLGLSFVLRLPGGEVGRP